jgi:hypothetical protein
VVLKRWLDYWHGIGEEHQYQFYRCEGCGRLVTHKKIKAGGCACLRSFKVRPAQLSLVEKARCLVMPWTV